MGKALTSAGEGGNRAVQRGDRLVKIANCGGSVKLERRIGYDFVASSKLAVRW